jgi:hypothetical protein
LVRQGWYLENELEATNTWNEIVGNRKSISNEYSLIPLHLMANFAKELGLPFSMDLELFHWIPPKLATVKATIESYVASAGNKSRPSDWFNKVTPMLTALRHDYLHFSAYYGSIANAPQWSGNDPINGNRTRIIQDG